MTTESIATALREKVDLTAPGAEIAFLVGETDVFYSSKSRAPHEPDSAVFRLVQGLWEKFGTDAIVHVRKPIITLSEPVELDRGIVRVAAKRIRFLYGKERMDLEVPNSLSMTEIGSSPPPEKPPLPQIFGPSSSITNENEGLQLAKALADQVQLNPSRALSARRIGAALVGPDGRLLAWGANAAGSNRTRHAEINCLQTYWNENQKPLEAGTHLYVSLKPCKMCAAAIWTVAEDPFSIRVVFAEPDLGPLARSTILDADSVERKRMGVPSSTLGIAIAHPVGLKP